MRGDFLPISRTFPPRLAASVANPFARIRDARRSVKAAASRPLPSRFPVDVCEYDRAVQKYVLSELDSGERVISERVPSVRSVALGFWIGAGSRDETDARAGLSHFIEHLLFKGSQQHSAQEIAEIFDGLGGELNAATSREHTVVYSRIPDKHLETAVEVMSNMVFAPTFDDLDAEREVVLEEIAMYEDTPQELVHDLFSEAVFASHALGRPVIGTREVISSVNRRTIGAYHRSLYTPGNIVISAAGNMQHDKLVKLLERAQRAARRGGARVRPPLVKVPPPGVRFQRKNTEQYHVCVGAPGISRSDRRRFAASLLDSILGGSASSRLFQEIREKRGMAYAVYTFAAQYSDTGLLGVYVGTREENLAACLEIVSEQIAEIAEGRLRPDELERAKENLKGRITLSMESTSNRMSRLGKSLITDTELLSFDRIIAEIEAVEPEGVAELASLLLAPDRLSAAGIGPSETRFKRALGRMGASLQARAA
jgi:predicted Zn-dependent peptidase